MIVEVCTICLYGGQLQGDGFSSVLCSLTIYHIIYSSISFIEDFLHGYAVYGLKYYVQKELLNLTQNFLWQ